MAATTTDRNTRRRSGQRRAVPVAAATKIPAGVMAAINASGLLVNGATATTLKCIGVPQATIDNSAGADSAITGEADTGVHGPFVILAGDPVTRANVGADVYMVDNQTIAATSGTGTRSVAGKLFDVDADGAWVNFA